MNKGSKYKSGQRPTFRIWDNEKNDWFKPTYDGWNGKIEELLLSPSGDLTMRTFTDFIHESVFPDRFEILRDESPITDEQAWNKVAEAYPETVQSLRITLDNAVCGHEAEPQKVKVPACAGELLDYYRKSTDVDLLALLICFKDWYFRKDKLSENEDAIDWLVKHPEKFMKAWLDGYEVEEEPKYCVNIGGLYLKEPLGDTNDFTISMTWNKDYAYPFDSWNMAREHTSELGGTVEKV